MEAKNLFHMAKEFVLLKKRLVIITFALLVLVFIVIALLSFSSSSLFTKSNFLTVQNIKDQDTRIKLQPIIAQTNINRGFPFPILDNNGKEVSKIIYTIENAELRNEIIVKGQKATAISGRTFFILNLKIKNESDKRIQVNTRDYIRLSINNNDQELLAADIYNDPVEIQPTSIKKTRIGFPINDTDKNLKLYVGEIKGEKKPIDIQF